MDRGVLMDLRAAEDRVEELEEALDELRGIVAHAALDPDNRSIWPPCRRDRGSHRALDPAPAVDGERPGVKKEIGSQAAAWLTVLPQVPGMLLPPGRRGTNIKAVARWK